jgi:hypothetical protein
MAEEGINKKNSGARIQKTEENWHMAHGPRFKEKNKTRPLEVGGGYDRMTLRRYDSMTQ